MLRDLSRGTNLQNSAWSKFQWLWSYSRLLQLFNINLFCCVMSDACLKKQYWKMNLKKMDQDIGNKLQVGHQNYQAGQF